MARKTIQDKVAVAIRTCRMSCSQLVAVTATATAPEAPTAVLSATSLPSM